MPRIRPCLRHLLACVLALGATAALAACGGGGAGAAPSTAPDATAVPSTTVVVTADVDGDGRCDVLEITLDGDGAPRCWRGRDDGTFVPVDAAEEHPGIDVIRDDLQRRPDHDILGDEGAHQAPTAGGTLPYAVLHLERGDEAPDREPGLPIIDELRPTRGQAGALVGIVGSDLAARDVTTTVRFDDLDARVLLALPRFVLTLVPERAPLGGVDVVVTRGSEASAAATFTVVDQPTPQLDRVQPDPLVPGVLAVLHGTDLGTPSDDVRVSFGGAASERVLALGRIVFAEVPEGATTGLAIVTVDGVASNGVDIEVARSLDAPSLTSVTPASASGGSLVRIEGDDLFVIGQTPRVAFGTRRAQLFGIERGALIAIVPDEADGDITVTVGDRTSEALPFERVARGAPVIASLDPTSGEAGDAIDILGTDLHDLAGLGAGASPARIAARLPRVSFGEVRAWFVFPIPGGLRAMVPFTADAGTTTVTVTLGDDTSNAAAFTVR